MNEKINIIKKYFRDTPREVEISDNDLIFLQAIILDKTGELLAYSDLETIVRYLKYEDVIKEELKETTPAERKRIEEIVDIFHRSIEGNC